jgi:tRNA1(Val) A37 N6-methylase TrmN6
LTISDLTDDGAISGRLRLLQPRRGHRFGHDAILLAAATRAEPGDVAVELGAGVGAAGLALALRVPRVRVKLVEIDAGLAALAAENARRNSLDEWVEAVALDVDAAPEAFAGAGMPPASCDVVLMNPPFNDVVRHPASPLPNRRRSHSLPSDALTRWVATAARLLRPAGVLTVIFRGDALDRLMTALTPAFGAITLLPVHPKPDGAAVRIIARAVKASRAPGAILPGLVLAGPDGEPSAEAAAVLRHAASLPLAAKGPLAGKSSLAGAKERA